MRYWKPLYTFFAIILITVLAVWISLPSNWLNFAGWKDNLYIRQGLDLQGGLQVVLEAQPPEGQSVDGGALEGARDTIERRVNELGVSEPVVQTRGDNQLIVELPGVGDPEAAVDAIRATALLEVIDTQGQYLIEGTKVNTTLGPGTTVDANGNEVPVEGTTYTTVWSGADLESANAGTDQFGLPAVDFVLTSDGGEKNFEFTSTNIDRPLSVVVDKEVINTATIQAAISRSGQITGLDREEARFLSAQLRSGALEVPLVVVQSRTVGPTLGQDSIDKSIVAGIIGLSLVAVMMILYYRVPGVLSVVALLIYTAIVIALFKLIPVTLTLAGIAGFILSIGMAVDANVLIFARLKDELRRGHSARVAVEDGFRHAWPSIRDSNAATMITCAILYWFGRYVGASIIQGFALTLFVGVAASMFTAIVVTRTFMRLLLARGWFVDRWWLGVEHTRPRTTTSIAD